MPPPPTPPRPSYFALPPRLAAKAEPALIADDEAHFAAVAASLERSIATLDDRLDRARRETATDEILDLEAGGAGQAALDRDQEVHRSAARLRTLRRYGVDLCLGRMVGRDGRTTYVGRLGLTGGAGDRLLVDWRSPAAEPFFGATHADPMGLASRRRYRWTGGVVTDYWDEVFDPDELVEHAAALDDQSAFVASLGGTRSARMRDVLGTIQADQDAIIRAGSRGALVVDGGPGTGKTVVALHRTAYLLYADPRLGHRRGGVLFVGPHEPYLAYVSDVLPSLGEEGVRTATVRDLVPEGASAGPEPDPEAARLKADARMVAAIEPAVRLYEEPPVEGMEVETPWGAVWVSPSDWADAFEAGAGVAHNEARDEVWEELVSILADKVEGASADIPADDVRRALLRDRELRAAFGRAWPVVESTDLVGDLWEVPAYLRRCAPWLAAEEVAALRRPGPQRWTYADLPLLDAARRRLGDPAASRVRREREAVLAAQRREMGEVIDGLLAADDGSGIVSSLRQQDLRDALVDEGAAPDPERDPLAGPFAHVVVDEAQELTDAEWQMLLARCPSRSLTIVGDRAQARRGFAETWGERLARVGLERVAIRTLGINYRTPAEVMEAAEPVIRAALPDANVPTSVRRTGVPVERATPDDLVAVVAGWLAEERDGTACVISTSEAAVPTSPRVRTLTPQLAKGLEFDLVVLVEPASFGEGVAGAVDRYVAMTRTTQRLVLLEG